MKVLLMTLIGLSMIAVGCKSKDDKNNSKPAKKEQPKVPVAKPEVDKGYESFALPENEVAASVPILTEAGDLVFSTLVKKGDKEGTNVYSLSVGEGLELQYKSELKIDTSLRLPLLDGKHFFFLHQNRKKFSFFNLEKQAVVNSYSSANELTRSDSLFGSDKIGVSHFGPHFIDSENRLHVLSNNGSLVDLVSDLGHRFYHEGTRNITFNRDLLVLKSESMKVIGVEGEKCEIDLRQVIGNIAHDKKPDGVIAKFMHKTRSGKLLIGTLNRYDIGPDVSENYSTISKVEFDSPIYDFCDLKRNYRVKESVVTVVLGSRDDSLRPLHRDHFGISDWFNSLGDNIVEFDNTISLLSHGIKNPGDRGHRGILFLNSQDLSVESFFKSYSVSASGHTNHREIDKMYRVGNRLLGVTNSRGFDMLSPEGGAIGKYQRFETFVHNPVSLDEQTIVIANVLRKSLDFYSTETGELTQRVELESENTISDYSLQPLFEGGSPSFFPARVSSEVVVVGTKGGEIIFVHKSGQQKVFKFKNSLRNAPIIDEKNDKVILVFPGQVVSFNREMTWDEPENE